MTPLERQERMLRDNLAGGALSGEQRRVQARLLHAVERDLQLDGRSQRAVEAGYEPFEPSEEWLWGYVEDPRLLRGHVRLASAVPAAPLGAGLAVGAALAWGIDLPAVILTALVLALGFYAVLHNILGWWAERRALTLPFPAEKGVRIFNSAMPAAATIAYRRARETGLFDTFVVYSPREADFRLVQHDQAPSLGLLDPVLVGLIGQQRFLIAQWDLATDLS